MCYRKIAIVASALMISGCTTTTSDIHKSARDIGSLETQAAYAQVLDNIDSAMRKCFPSQSNRSARTYTRIKHIEDGKLARIEGMFETYLGLQVKVSIDIIAKPEGTKINYYSDYYGLLDKARFKPLLTKWVSGEFDCDSDFAWTN